MKIKKVKINETDLIANYLPAHFSDSFECTVNTSQKISADDVMVTFWTKNPVWVDKLFKLRDWIVRPFGIQSGNDRNSDLLENAIRSGGNYKFFKTTAKSANETLINADDKHLMMYFSIKVDLINQEQQRLSASTVVHFHNWLGRAYFFFIRPFHRVIVPSMIRHSIKSLLSNEMNS